MFSFFGFRFLKNFENFWFFRFFWKISDFRNLKNENIFRKFSKFLKIFFDIFLAKVSKYDPSSRYTISGDEFRTMATIFRVVEFQLQLIFMHIDSFFVQNQLLYSIRSSAQRAWGSPETRFFMKNQARVVAARP